MSSLLIFESSLLIFDMLGIMTRDLNFTAPLSLSVDGKLGGKNKDGSWNGMVGMLTRNETDVVLAALTYTAIRKTAIDYTIPIFYPDEITLFGQRGVGGGVDYLLYMKLFPPIVWALVFASVLTFTVGFLIIAMSGTNRFHGFSDSESFGVSNSIALSVMLLIQNQEYKVLYKSTAARVCFLFGSLVSYLIFTYFSSDLTATLTTASNIPPIKNFQDVMDKGFRVVTRESSASHEWLKMAAEGSWMQKFYLDYMHDNPEYLVTSGGEVFDKISRDSNLMYWGPDVHMVGKELQYKKYSLEETATSYDGMGIQADSEYAELLNYWLHRFEESGVKDRLWANWTYVGEETFWEEDIEPIDEVVFSFPAFILVAGMLLSVIFLAFEKVGSGSAVGRNAHHKDSVVKKFAP